MTDHNNNKPISTFDEICHLTIETMRQMDMETLLQLKKQATREFDRAKLTKGCIELALSLKAQDQDRAIKEADSNQQSLLDD
ncbi:hypothetical protein N9W34_00015 [Rickettsiales bacterium]|nr:hypothetical protein [Rickettsiales bacterium]